MNQNKLYMLAIVDITLVIHKNRQECFTSVEFSAFQKGKKVNKKLIFVYVKKIYRDVIFSQISEQQSYFKPLSKE